MEIEDNFHHDAASLETKITRESSVGMPLHPPRFSVDDKVFARDFEAPTEGTTNTSNALDPSGKPCYYKAVIRAVRLSTTSNTPPVGEGSKMVAPPERTWMYLVHYTGWNSRWDRWLPDHNLLLPSEAEQDENAHIVHKRKHLTTTTTTSSPGASNKRRVSAFSGGSEDASARPLAYRDVCSLPLTLQIVLMDEYERLHRTVPGRVVRSLHTLPAKVTVRQVLNHFVKRQQEEHPEAADFVTFMLQIFHKALPICLLYVCERPQFEHLQSSLPEDTDWSDVYGPEFLLRLYVRLPLLLPSTVTNNTQMNNNGTSSSNPLEDPQTLGRLLADLVVLMQRNRSTLFATPSQYKFAEHPHEWTAHELATCQAETH
jgi:mortality factor 4-like protein 1